MNIDKEIPGLDNLMSAAISEVTVDIHLKGGGLLEGTIASLSDKFIEILSSCASNPKRQQYRSIPFSSIDFINTNVFKVEKDAKGRICLGDLAEEISSYKITETSGDKIVLEPYLEIPLVEKLKMEELLKDI